MIQMDVLKAVAIRAFIALKRSHINILKYILTNDIIAANNKILTRRSSNCSKTNCHMDFPANKRKNCISKLQQVHTDTII